MGKRPCYEGFIKKNYAKINEVANLHGLSFIFHEALMDRKANLDDTLPDYKFLKKISAMSPQKYYDALEWQIFSYQAIDPVYVVRKYNNKMLVAWGHDAFLREPNSLQFPYECFLPLDNIVIGSFCQLNPYSENWRSNTEYKGVLN